MEAVSDQNGWSVFPDMETRQVYSYEMNSSCYEGVSGTFYLETDTTVELKLKQGLTGEGMPIVQSLEKLLLKPALDGTFYIVKDGTEPVLEVVKKKFIWKQEVSADNPITINLNDFPKNVQFWLYFVAKNCSQYLKSGTQLIDVLENDPEEVTIYPNPARDFITIQLKNPQRFKIEILNVQGTKIFQTEKTGISHNVDLLSFSSGIYFVLVESDDFIVTQKFLKH